MLKQYRKYVTSSVGFTFLVVGATGMIFKFFFKTHTLEEIHGWLGVAMFVAAIWHIAHNWGAIQNYLRDKRVLALLIPVVLVIAVIVATQEKETERGVSPRQVVRELSRGSFENIAKAFGKDSGAVMTAMKADGLSIENEHSSLEDIARANHKRPEGLMVYFLK